METSRGPEWRRFLGATSGRLPHGDWWVRLQPTQIRYGSGTGWAEGCLALQAAEDGSDGDGIENRWS